MGKQDENDSMRMMGEAIGAALERALSPFAGAMAKLAERIERLETGQPAKKTADETMVEMMKEIRGDPDLVATIGLVEVINGCTSDLGAPDAEGNMRGAKFDAEVHYRPTFLNGKLVGKSKASPIVRSLLNYAYPEGTDKHQKQGGLVPDGLEIVTTGADGRTIENPDYKQWRYVTFWQADLRRFLGKVLPAHVRAQALPVETGT